MSDYRPADDHGDAQRSETSGPPPLPSQGGHQEIQPYPEAYPPPPGAGAPPQGGYQGPPQGGYQGPPQGTGHQVPPQGAMPYGQAGYAPQPRKEPAISLLVSFFVPGVGSMMNGDTSLGVGILVGYLMGLVLLICLGWAIVGFIGLPISLGFWAWGMVDAYQGAVRWNQRQGYPG